MSRINREASGSVLIRYSDSSHPWAYSGELQHEYFLRPFVESVQKLPPGIPWIGHPQSKLGVRALESVVLGASVLSATGIVSSFSRFTSIFSRAEEPFQLPGYEAFRQ